MNFDDEKNKEDVKQKTMQSCLMMTSAIATAAVADLYAKERNVDLIGCVEITLKQAFEQQTNAMVSKIGQDLDEDPTAQLIKDKDPAAYGNMVTETETFVTTQVKLINDTIDEFITSLKDTALELRDMEPKKETDGN